MARNGSQSSIQRLPQYVNRAATISVPAPTGGWNARDSLDDMDPADAVSLVNMFPAFGRVSPRAGSAVYASGLGGAVETLAEYNSGGVRKLLAAAGGAIYEVTNGGSVITLGLFVDSSGQPIYNSADGTVINTTTVNNPTAILMPGFKNNRWQTAQFRNAALIGSMIFVNGVDLPQSFDGSVITAATISGAGLNVRNLVGVLAYNTRMFYWENSSQILWYSAIGAPAGVLTAFNLGELSGFGGNIANISTWTRDGGSGPQDYCVILMTSGDVIMYQGTDISLPGSWSLVGIFRIGSPIGIRCTMKLGPDVAIINRNGFVPLSQVMPGLWNPSEALSNKITFAAQQATSLFADNYGWQPLLYPDGNMAIFNIPISSTVSEQYVMNTAIGAWCRFTGLNAICWSLFKDKPYFGDAYGNVIRFDTGGTDLGSPISIYGQMAWNYFGDRTRLKRLCILRPAIANEGDLSIGFTAGADFAIPQTPSPLTIAGAGTAWGSPWGSPWAGPQMTVIPRIASAGVGNCFSIIMAATVSNAPFDWFSTTIQYEPGTGI